MLFQFFLFQIEELRNSLIVQLKLYPQWGWAILPVLSAILGGLAAWGTARTAPEAAGSGIPHIKGVLLNVRELNWRRVLPVKFMGGLLAIGGGFSLGREGPTVQMGASAGDMVCDALKIKGRDRQSMIACGAGAGLAAAFNAPLSGFLFVIEELQREFSSTTYGTTFIAAVSAGAVARFATGQLPSFHVNSFPIPPLSALPLFGVLGLVAGLFGVLINKGILRASDIFPKISVSKPWIKGAIVGAIVGYTAWWLPGAVGGGHSTAEWLLNGTDMSRHGIILLVLLLGAKYILTILSYSTGVPGGFFAPILLMGATLGMLVGQIAGYFFPVLINTPAAFAVVGMGATFVAVTRAPLTGIALILEMTASQEQLFALLFACLIAYLVAELFRTKPIYDALLEHDLTKAGYGQTDEGKSSVIELIVEEGSHLVERGVAEVEWPVGVLLVMIHRGGKEIVPSGRTRLKIGYRITILTSGQNPMVHETLVRFQKG